MGGSPLLARSGELIWVLYKSRAPRPTDEADFRLPLPALTTEKREWLRLAID